MLFIHETTMTLTPGKQYTMYNYRFVTLYSFNIVSYQRNMCRNGAVSI